LTTPIGWGKRDMKYVRRLVKVLLIKVTLPPLHHLPFSQTTLYLLNDVIPNRLGFK
jgi:hypothetical protein